jgi:IS605 OrfB family transposase
MVSKIVFDTYCVDRDNMPKRIQQFQINNTPIIDNGKPTKLYYYLRNWISINWNNGSKVGGFPSGLLQQVFKQVVGSYNSLLTRYHNIKHERRKKLLTKPAIYKDTIPIQYTYDTMNFKLLDPSIIGNIGYGTISTSVSRTMFDFVYGENVREHLMRVDADTHEAVPPWELDSYVKKYLKQQGHRPNLLGSKICGTKLIYRKTKRQEGKFFLHITLEKEVPTSIHSTTDTLLSLNNYLGVDLGITNIATTSHGTNYSGSKLDHTRAKRTRYRQGLQRRAKALKSKRRNRIYRKIRKQANKERKFHKDINHCIAKNIVAEAERTSSRVIVLEKLSGIREQLKARRKQRNRMHSWSFAQLQEYIQYKAKLKGIRVMYIDPRHTSQRCSSCGHVERSNRGSGTKREQFVCKSCSYLAHSDYNAAINIRDIGYTLDPVLIAA